MRKIINNKMERGIKIISGIVFLIMIVGMFTFWK